MRGEHVWNTIKGIFDVGSSPRARGAHRIDHVHAAGGGSSPRARGARATGARGSPGLGIIPACAGSTRRAATRVSSARDHPRVRGEHRIPADQSGLAGGSSPRARGARPNPGKVLVRTGIIPACAGSTPRAAPTRTVPGDHPRVRGEHPWTGGMGFDFRWIIPACAGSTGGALPGDRSQGDHPRVRGEHCIYVLNRQITKGSSPRARGARRNHHGDVSEDGIIPACAGSTAASRRVQFRHRDHPRVRGEH